MNINTNKIAQEAVDAISEKIKNLNTLNIIVAGKTGVGKSTLINSVFRDKLADTGMGKPVTEHMRKISKKGIPLAIYDTRGFELGKEVQKQVKKEVVETISKGLATKDINKSIHCIWYCINTVSNRIEPEEFVGHGAFRGRVPGKEQQQGVMFAELRFRFPDHGAFLPERLKYEPRPAFVLLCVQGTDLSHAVLFLL